MRLLALAGLVATIALALAQAGLAHPGPVDQDGCHYDSAGNYHCH